MDADFVLYGENINQISTWIYNMNNYICDCMEKYICECIYPFLYDINGLEFKK